MSKILDKLKQWENTFSFSGQIDYNAIHRFISFRAKESFNSYYPTSGSGKDFEARLIGWLNNLDDLSQQSLLFRLVPNIYFFSEEEFKSLYRAAYNDVISNWLINIRTDTLNLFDEKLQDKLEEEMTHTWFCSITDSMNIASFCHINNIHGNSNRPNWRDFSWFADMNKVKNYINLFEIRQIVLLEDFIGSGDQLLKKDKRNNSSIIDCVDYIQNECNFLIAPLIICPKGHSNISKLIEERNLKNVELEPVVILSDECFINEDRIFNMQAKDENTKNHRQDLFNLLKTINKKIEFKNGSFGYKNTGSLIVLYTNCPNNTISVIHENKGNEWRPLFPRINRE
jgi:hypothetical protein